MIFKAFNFKFSTIAHTPFHTPATEFVSERVSSLEFHFQLIDYFSVHRIIEKLKLREAAGLDGIPPFVLRALWKVVFLSLANIVNTSLLTGNFSDSLRIATVMPVAKVSDPAGKSDWQPISFLSVFAKVFEK